MPPPCRLTQRGFDGLLLTLFHHVIRKGFVSLFTWEGSFPMNIYLSTVNSNSEVPACRDSATWWGAGASNLPNKIRKWSQVPLSHQTLGETQNSPTRGCRVGG